MRRTKNLVSGKRSKLEDTVQNKLDLITKSEYEVDKIKFIQPEKQRYYLPDFKLPNGHYIEAKGRLTTEDRQKMIWVKEQYPDLTFYFIFGNGSNKITKRSKTTYLDWAKSNGFDAIDVSQPIPKRWLK